MPLYGRRRNYGYYNNRRRIYYGRKLRGRGGYWDDFKAGAGRWARALGRSQLQLGGGLVGNMVGGPVGGFVGNVAGYKLGQRLFGSGAYRSGTAYGTVRAYGGGRALGAAIPNAIPRRTYVKVGSKRINMGQPKPTFKSNSKAVTVCHTEFISDITSSTAFTNSTFSINPGLATSFPWLANIASNFEIYRFKSLVFYYKSTAANALNSTNNALGVVIGATSYNVLANPFANKQQMEDYEFAKSEKPTKDNIYPVECARFQNPLEELYIRTSNVTNGDQRMYDMGLFQLATVGSQAAAVVGELWVAYEVDLIRPKLVNVGSENETCHFKFTATSGGYTGVPGTTELPASATNPFGNVIGATATTPQTTKPPEVGSAFAPILTQNTGTGVGTITMPSNISTGTFMFLWTVAGGSQALTGAPNFTATSGAIAANLLFNDVANTVRTNATTTNNIISVGIFTITAPSATITLGPGSGTYPNGQSGFDLWITALNPNILTMPKLKLHPGINNMNREITPTWQIVKRIQELTQDIPMIKSQEDIFDLPEEKTEELSKEDEKLMEILQQLTSRSKSSSEDEKSSVSRPSPITLDDQFEYVKVPKNNHSR